MSRAPGPSTISWFDFKRGPRRRTACVTRKAADWFFDQKAKQLRNSQTDF